MIHWLHKRGITDEVIALFNITIHNHPQIGECIRIPVVDGPNGWAKYRRDPLQDLKPKYLYDSGGKVTLYGADKLRGKDDGKYHVQSNGYDLKMLDNHTQVLVTEGELDTLVAWSHNIPAVSSTGGAMSWQEEWAKLLTSYDVYLAFDNDDAGAEGMVRVLQYIPTAKVVLIPETPGVKDISDYVSRGGDLHKLIQSAKTYASVSDVEEDMAHRKATWQSTRFHEKFLEKARHKEQRSNAEPNPYTGTDPVLKARAYPMTNLIEFKRNKACCPWHKDATPSLAYYPKTNSAYCFGACGKGYDAIDAYMHVHGCGFKEAIKELNKLV